MFGGFVAYVSQQQDDGGQYLQCFLTGYILQHQLKHRAVQDYVPTYRRACHRCWDYRSHMDAGLTFTRYLLDA